MGFYKKASYTVEMYIVAIGWLYVTLMMAATETSLVAGIMTFLFYGLLPAALFVWLIGTPQRRRSAMAAKQQAGKPDRSDAQAD